MATHLTLEVPAPGYWRVTFQHPPINTITAGTVAELSELVGRFESEPDLKVVVFTSANPDFFLAHYDTEGDPARTVSMPPGPSGMHPWLDLTCRLAKAPVVSIAAIRGRARGAGSEFVLACDLRFASRENTVLGQFEVGIGLIPGNAVARLTRLAGRSRALEILLVADDLDGELAEKYGYINRLIPDDQLDAEVDALARRLVSFERYAIAGTKRYVDDVSLPDDSELPAALEDFFNTSARPEAIARRTELVRHGYNTHSDLELRLGRRITEFA